MLTHLVDFSPNQTLSPIVNRTNLFCIIYVHANRFNLCYFSLIRICTCIAFIKLFITAAHNKENGLYDNINTKT